MAASKHPLELVVDAAAERVSLFFGDGVRRGIELTYAEAEALSADLAAAAKRLKTRIAVNRVIRSRIGTPPAPAPGVDVDPDDGGDTI